MPHLVHITAVIVIRYEAITHRFGVVRSDIHIHIDYLAFQRPSPKLKPNIRFGQNNKAQVDLQCILTCSYHMV